MLLLLDLCVLVRKGKVEMDMFGGTTCGRINDSGQLA